MMYARVNNDTWVFVSMDERAIMHDSKIMMVATTIPDGGFVDVFITWFVVPL